MRDEDPRDLRVAACDRIRLIGYDLLDGRKSTECRRRARRGTAESGNGGDRSDEGKGCGGRCMATPEGGDHEAVLGALAAVEQPILFDHSMPRGRNQSGARSHCRNLSISIHRSAAEQPHSHTNTSLTNDTRRRGRGPRGPRGPISAGAHLPREAHPQAAHVPPQRGLPTARAEELNLHPGVPGLVRLATRQVLLQGAWVGGGYGQG